MQYLYGVLIAVSVFFVITLIRAAFFRPKEGKAEALPPENVDTERYRKNLSESLTYKTISDRDPKKMDFAEFERFHEFLRNTYPLIHEKLELEKVSYASLLYRWKGKNPKLDPIAMLSHQDVVPISKGTLDDWTHPPFSGFDDGEFIWGRGALDMKNHLIGVMESVETLLEEGFIPERDVYLCFGHDEEVMSSDISGAKAIVNLLSERGIRLDAVLDEGGAMLPVNVKGVINKKVAGIGLAEKGHADFKISVNAKGGHSSQPPKHSALGELANVIRKLENNQFKSELTPMMRSLFDKVGRSTSYPVRLIACNLPLLKYPVLAIMKRIPPAACMIRTTTAVTQAEGSPAPNVLPQKASITANFRIMPGMTVEDVEEHVKKVVGDRVEVELIKGQNPSNVSPTNSRAFLAIDEICRSTDEDTIVAPFLVMGGTDARNYEPICGNVYRYAPFTVNTGLLLACHGTNERIPVETLTNAVAFFKRYIKKVSAE